MFENDTGDQENFAGNIFTSYLTLNHSHQNRAHAKAGNSNIELLRSTLRIAFKGCQS